MKNLKKVLALVLAFACAFTMFAGAAFTDSADIKVDADVVDTLVSLGIVEGFEDGSLPSAHGLQYRSAGKSHLRSPLQCPAIPECPLHQRQP